MNSSLSPRPNIPAVSIVTARSGASAQVDERGMRPMQARAYAQRGAQYLLIKSPPASGKSRALMFIALDKIKRQGLRQAIVAAPERSIGASFNDEPLTRYGFEWDWRVEPQWNLCNAPGVDEPRLAKSKVRAVAQFLQSSAETLVCTHATFRFAIEELGAAAFDHCLLAVDEFHHVSSNPDNRLGAQLGELIARGSAHIVAMTGSYFRGDGMAVLSAADEAKFVPVTYTYYEQLNSYQYLKALDIGHYFYANSYLHAIIRVLDATLKTIVHIPNVNSRESLGDKHKEAEEIMLALGEWQYTDAATGFQIIRLPPERGGRIIKVADLVDDDSARRNKVLTALKDPAQRANRDHVDIIIALGMAKEGFDWVWCEHALTIGYRSSLTEIVQIIGRATRDAPGKTRARFTNLIAEPDASEERATEAINDTLKAIAASLLMEQVLAPRYEFTTKNAGPLPGFDYGETGYQANGRNAGVNEAGTLHLEINGLAQPTSAQAQRICREDLNEVITAFVQDKEALERGLFDQENTLPVELNLVRMGKIVRERYPELSSADQEAVRQHAVAVLNITQQAKQHALSGDPTNADAPAENLDLIMGVRRFVNVRDLDIDLIDRINPFEAAYAILAKALDEKTLRQVEAAIAAKKPKIDADDARMLAERAMLFKQERGRLPKTESHDPWERLMADGLAALTRYRKQELAKQTSAAMLPKDQ